MWPTTSSCSGKGWICGDEQPPFSQGAQWQGEEEGRGQALHGGQGGDSKSGHTKVAFWLLLIGYDYWFSRARLGQTVEKANGLSGNI